MRILTVRQPWAWAIIHGGKDVENRTRNIAGDYRGPVAIHAGLADDEEADIALWVKHGTFYANNPAQRFGPITNSARGAIVGVVHLVDVHVDQDATHGGCWTGHAPRDGGETIEEMCSPWAMRDHHHLVLANPRALATPIPAKGRLGLWTPDHDLEHAITTALAAIEEA